MSIVVKKFRSPQKAISFLENLALGNDDYIFRGHSEESYKLTTTLSRHSLIPHFTESSDIDEMLDMFRAGLVKLDIMPFESDNRQDWLEYARHHGVPTPILDFSYSPYIAMFFAFNGVKIKRSYSKTEYVVIYAVEIKRLGWLWASLTKGFKGISDETYRNFLFPKDGLFNKNFPGNCLQFIPLPSKFNYRMLRQKGAFVYDTLDYQAFNVSHLEELIENHREPSTTMPDGSIIPSDPTLYKIMISKEVIQEILSLLDLMGITAGSLYANADGVAMDVINSYYYNTKTGYLRDLRFSPPEV